MSAIASFYLIAENQIDQLLIAAEIKENKKSFLGFTRTTARTDNYWEFLSTSAREQTPFEFKGGVFLYLLEVLEELQADFYDHEIKEASLKLRELRNSSSALFDADGAKAALAELNSAELKNETITSINKVALEEELEEDDVEVVLHSFEILKQWLETVEDGQIGLFNFY